MAQVRGARRAAEKAARERLAGPLISAVGELGVAVAQQHAAATAVQAAEERAKAHLRQAQIEAEKIVTDARGDISTADDAYRTAHDAAVTAGWSPAALTDMGYAAPPSRRVRSSAAAPAAQPVGDDTSHADVASTAAAADAA